MGCMKKYELAFVAGYIQSCADKVKEKEPRISRMLEDAAKFLIDYVNAETLEMRMDKVEEALTAIDKIYEEELKKK